MADKPDPESPTVASPLRDRDVARLRAVVAESPEALFGESFEVVREAGAGGMGTVYEAIERATSRRVAIKVITGLAGPSAHARFAAEIEVIERLDHPAIVDYVAHGETAHGEPYLAMEWLVGESLSQRLERERLSIIDAVILGERIGDALTHSHAAGVVHRDLKPSNIFLVEGKAAEAHLIDFGIAKQADRDLTNTGQLIGTPGYMAPEQARGDKTVGASADLFALGCVLYRAISGKDAFGGVEVMEILARLLLEDPEPIDHLVSDVPPRLVHLIGSLLSKDPAGRLGDAAIVVTELRELRRALDARDDAALALRPEAVPAPVPASDPTLRDDPGSLHRDYRRRRGWWGLAAVGVLAAIAIVLVVTSRGGDSCSDATPDACAASCESGDATACYLYARVLHDANRPDLVNHEKARELDVKACEGGETRACSAAAKSLVAVATKHTPDPTAARLLLAKAEKMYVIACDRGDLEACKLLGRMLSKGQGPLPPDPPRAFGLVIHACERGHASACSRLPEMAGDPNNGADDTLRARAREVWAAACARQLAGVNCSSTP